MPDVKPIPCPKCNDTGHRKLNDQPDYVTFRCDCPAAARDNTIDAERAGRAQDVWNRDHRGAGPARGGD